MITIAVDDLWLAYTGRDVLRGVSFELTPGQLVGLVGPNGSGKSTMIRALTRTASPRRGRILLNGQDIKGISRGLLAQQVGVVPQMPLLPSAFTAFEIVLMGRNPHMKFLQHEGERDLASAWQAMERTGTQHLAHRRVAELSGGEIQSLLIARVLVQDTPVILMDEPTANLDIGRQIEIVNLIKGLCREKQLTVLAALHDLNLASQYCDRLLLINHGSLHRQGTPAEVITAENIGAVYGADNCVYSHPANGLPVVLVNGCAPGAPKQGSP